MVWGGGDIFLVRVKCPACGVELTTHITTAADPYGTDLPGRVNGRRKESLPEQTVIVM
jgi:hypothetical protein